MAQSATTVTNPNPSPPTNVSSTGVTGPNPTNNTKNTQRIGPDGTIVHLNDNWGSGTPTYPPPFYDDGVTQSTTAFSINENIPPSGTTASPQAFAANTAALAGGTGATSGGTENTYPGTDTAPFDTPNMVGAVPASTSVAHEEAGNVTVVTATVPNPSPAGQLKTVSTGPNLTPGTMPQPNALAASYQSAIPTATSLSANNTASGGGTIAQTITGTGFTAQSVIWVNGVAQVTTFTSPTSISATVTKKATSGTWPVYVINAGVVSSNTLTWTFT